MLTALLIATLPICEGPNRAARHVTCIVDGDTGWQDGMKWRLLDIDAPEVGHPACANELKKGKEARERLSALMAGGYRVDFTGKYGRYGRPLVRIQLANGEDAGERLIAEGLAQQWPNKGNVWCDE